VLSLLYCAACLLRFRQPQLNIYFVFLKVCGSFLFSTLDITLTSTGVLLLPSRVGVSVCVCVCSDRELHCVTVISFYDNKLLFVCIHLFWVSLLTSFVIPPPVLPRIACSELMFCVWQIAYREFGKIT
jgi:hypothetical protein